MKYTNTRRQINRFSTSLSLCILFCIASFSSTAQLIVTGNRTATQLAHTLAGSGITILNPKLTCFYKANGSFVVDTVSPLGIDSGIVLSTGAVTDSLSSSGSVIGSSYGVANSSSKFASSGWDEPGDTELTNLAGGEVTNDACILQFDLIPAGDSIKFNYVFGSEEYTSFACSQFNDVFGFFISGGGYTVPVNIALVPGTSIPVCINSVNCGATGGYITDSCSILGPGAPFCTYYINNTLTTSIAKPYVVYDGLTTLLQAKAAVSPCDTYHLKLAIADGTDGAYDSGVFIAGGSLSSGSANISITNPNYCGNNNGSITISALQPGSKDTLNYQYNSVAQPTLEETVDSTGNITISNLCAGIYNNLTITTPGACSYLPFAPITLSNPPYSTISVNSSNPTTCGVSDGIITLHGLQPGQEVTIHYTRDGLVQPNIDYFVGPDGTYTFTGLSEGVYNDIEVVTGGVCEASNPNACNSNIIGPVTLTPINIAPSFSYMVKEGCHGDTLFFSNLSSVPGDPHIHYSWNFGDGSAVDTSLDPIHLYTNTIHDTDTITLSISYLGCDSSFSLPVVLNNFVTASFTSAPASYICQDSSFSFTNTSTGTSPSYTWYFGDATTATDFSPVHTYLNEGSYQVMLIAANEVPCYDTATEAVAVDSNSLVSIHLTDTVFCQGQGITFTGTYSLIGFNSVTWTFGDSSRIEDLNPIVHAYEHTGSSVVTMHVTYRTCPDKTISDTLLIVPAPTLDLGPDTSICPGSIVYVLYDKNNSGDHSATWLWSTGETTPEITINAPGNYYATVSINGCSASDSVLVANDCYIDIPNVFTPNGDGINDYFFPRQYLTRGLTSFQMKIYNRWGQQIFSTGELDGRGWDGNLNNTPQPTGVYVYIIDATFKDGEKEHKQGNVTLLR